ncbi:hypothetical protein CP98_01424 [Sphingobium yanoikuyae]|uniref:Uncharacterized protein n=1 Tax=Sphingobium yanoikuyae TaxID=13690 RepID=A0A084EQH7_SPHYA|nr:hypothetical protein CP98_01424 [Sphingobium yanoikuyae]
MQCAFKQTNRVTLILMRRMPAKKKLDKQLSLSKR